jgi:uncharacterized protein with ParB-like and HNH nuclease domain
MKGSEAKMTGFMEGADKRFIIPVYQRKYDWKYENCHQLYEDLKRIIIDERSSHFFGSIVSAIVPNGSKIEYHIIDGQQRLTTITLLLLAMQNLVAQGKVKTTEGRLDEQISHRFLVSPWAGEYDRIKLRPVKSDREALAKLFGDEDDYDRSSNLTINYMFFYEMVEKEEVTIDELYAAIGKLEIISITLDQGDKAQLIFESLNSTGLALTEGDKIRNYVLMGLPSQNQTKYYDDYWAKIEKCTANDVSGFVRDYLSIKQQVTPTMSNVYHAFKRYSEKAELSVDKLLTDLLRYARYFEKLCSCKSLLHNQKLDDCLYRLMRLEIVVTRPFLMEVFRLHQDSEITVDDVLKIFLVTENYLFRRNICEVPTSALNKIFVNLNKEIIRYDNTADNYVGKFIYALLSKKESGRFPDDEEFITALTEKQVYQMRGRYKAYLFERFENYGTIETKDVYTHLDNNVYTIEHIMPQHLTPAWKESLGDNAVKIHETWLHRLANLTLTGYNPSLSNNTYIEKRDAKDGGYKVSGLKMNQKISMQSTWGLQELKARSDEMAKMAMEIWVYPVTEFIPAEKEFDSCTLDDENYDLTGRDIAKYSYLNLEQPVNSWTDMFEHIVKFLHQKDKSVLTGIAFDSKNKTDFATYISSIEADYVSAWKIDDNVYIKRYTSTTMKISILRKIFMLFKADPMDLVFYLKDLDSMKTVTNRHIIRKRYWEYALPIIKEQNNLKGMFSNCLPSITNTVSGFFGINGFNVRCIANYDNARIDFYLGNSDINKNKDTFDLLYSHKDEIEEVLGIDLEWDRADFCKASSIGYVLHDVSIINEVDWPQMAKFHAEWSARIAGILLPYLHDENSMRLQNIAIIFREWAMTNTEAITNLSKCNRTYTRFTTKGMTAILPDLPNAPSGWNTDNHYFYEIINRNGKEAYIKLAINSNNTTDDFRAICDKINEFYPAKIEKKEWIWRTQYKTSNISIPEDLSKDIIFEGLNSCMDEIHAFEFDLSEKMKRVDEIVSS